MEKGDYYNANIGVQVFVWTYAFDIYRYLHKSGIAKSYGNSMFNFLRSCQTIIVCLFSFSHARECEECEVSMIGSISLWLGFAFP